MANLFKESFSIENAADLSVKWSGSSLTAIGLSYGRLGGYGATVSNSDLVENIPSLPATITFGFAANMQSGHSMRLYLNDHLGNTNLFFQYDSNHNLSVSNYNGSTIFNTSNTAIPFYNTWNYIEIQATMSTSATGSFTLKVNGDTIFTRTGIQTANTLAEIGQVYFTSPGGGDTMWITDVYINDATGSTNNGFMGDIKQLTGRPNGAGLDTNWSIGGTSPAATNWQSVDDPQPNYDVTYVDDLTPGDIDLYAMSVPSGLNTFESLTVYAMVRKDDAGTRQVAACISNGTTVFVGPTYTIGTTYSYIQGTWDTNPFTSAAWAVADASTLQIGVKCIA